ncbi:hypothetical protein N8E89_09435 [Phyllobacterium sp. A18/5-2]|uniref:hypothetical protein n=1 Tax=Phyllobacterium sp. A18/5-2 TaxID=2978392 RepID=UPI0021CA5B1A|nr:hypothetical protein [Phyllobacterium sp. A18/5-2]UXN62937.1 hypothetical protein N8E89_09435 [Phyllobacterium sp. A18/5-2]
MLIDIHEITESMTALTKYECKHGPMTVNANSGVLSSGSDCWLGFEVGSKGVSSVDLILPSTLIGNLRQNSPEFEIKFTDVATAPLISVFDESSPPVEFGDRVEIMKGGSSQVSFESVETYCLRLKIEPPG